MVESMKQMKIVEIIETSKGGWEKKEIEGHGECMRKILEEFSLKTPGSP